MNQFNLNQKLIIYFISAFIYSYFAGFSMGDDGLRHIAFSAYPDVMKSWGDVFPHSLFMMDYDPWFFWHSIISFYLKFFSYNVVHIAINTTVLFLLMILLDLLLTKYSTLKFGTLSILIILSIVLLSYNRYINIRPDLLSGLYLMSALLLTKRPILLFILTLLYSPSYYLFFLYTGSMGLVYLTLKDNRAFFSVFIASVIGLCVHLYLGGEGFIQTVIYVLSDQSLRMGLEVSEGEPLYDFLKIFNYYIFVIILGSIISLIIYKKYEYFKRQPIALLLLIMSILWLMQVRYFLLLLPLIIVLLVLESKFIILSILSRNILYYIFKMSHILKLASRKTVFYILAIPYTILMFGLSMGDDKFATTLENKSYFKNKIFDNKRILLSAMTTDIYYGLYQNPSIKFVPSCAIGWFDGPADMKDIYIRMMKKDGISESELEALLNYVGADYYIHTLNSARQKLSFQKMKDIGLNPLFILNNSILFEYKHK